MPLGVVQGQITDLVDVWKLSESTKRVFDYGLASRTDEYVVGHGVVLLYKSFLV